MKAIILKSDRNDVTNFVIFHVDKFENFLKKYQSENKFSSSELIYQSLVRSTQSHEVIRPFINDFLNSLPDDCLIVDVNKIKPFATIFISSNSEILFEAELIPQSKIDPKRPTSKVVINRDNVLDYMEKSTNFPYEPKEIGINCFGIYITKTKTNAKTKTKFQDQEMER